MQKTENRIIELLCTITKAPGEEDYVQAGWKLLFVETYSSTFLAIHSKICISTALYEKTTVCTGTDANRSGENLIQQTAAINYIILFYIIPSSTS